MSSVVVISQYFGVVLAAAIGVFTGLATGRWGIWGDWAFVTNASYDQWSAIIKISLNTKCTTVQYVLSNQRHSIFSIFIVICGFHVKINQQNVR